MTQDETKILKAIWNMITFDMRKLILDEIKAMYDQKKVQLEEVESFLDAFGYKCESQAKLILNITLKQEDCDE